MPFVRGSGGRSVRLTHCKRGHELTPGNVYEGIGYRQCRRCSLDRGKARHEARAETLKYRHLRIKSLDDVRKYVCVDDATGCWVWQRGRQGAGYGMVRYQGKQTLASRMVAMLLGWDVRGMLVCHHCDNPPCCNPAHLYVGTQSDNSNDMWKRQRRPRPYSDRKACAHGHEYTPESTYITRQGHRMCRICTRERQRAAWPTSRHRLERMAWAERARQRRGE